MSEELILYPSPQPLASGHICLFPTVRKGRTRGDTYGHWLHGNHWLLPQGVQGGSQGHSRAEWKDRTGSKSV